MGPGNGTADGPSAATAATQPTRRDAADDEPLPFARPSITAREEAAVLDVLRSGWLTTGPRAKAFEERFAAVVGSRYAIALNSATAAIHLALEAAGVGRGDEVIVPTWTFAASAEVAVHLGATPILIDVEPESLNASADAFLAAVTPRTKAVVAVHFAGRPMAIDDLVRGLDRVGIPVIEDAAHALPSRIEALGGRFAGTIGRAGAYSFYVTKTITTGEGGMLVTDDAAIADRARLMSLHGISRHAWTRYLPGGSWEYDIEDTGFKDNLTDIAAALGIVQLDRMDELHAARQALVRGYVERFTRAGLVAMLDLPVDTGDGSHAWHLFVVRLRPDAPVSRDDLMTGLQQRGIGASVHFKPLHLHSYYRRHPESTPFPLPVATEEYRWTISIPLWPGMSGADQDRVVEAFVDLLLDGGT